MNDVNISDFIDNNTAVISDPEGYSIDAINSQKYIICGDIIDSTYAANVPEKIINKCYNLQNIRNILCIPEKYKLMFGNRDLNKFKCGFLCYIQNVNNNKLSDNLLRFNNGNIDLSINNYKLLINDISTDVTWNGNMNNWYTFWSGTIGQGKEWEKMTEYTSQNFFVGRFYDIFGVDNGKINGGTMSAQNLLYTIPLEIGLIDRESLLRVIKESDKTMIDYLAFVVLAVFKSMCLNVDICVDDVMSNDITKCHNSSKFKGWLYNLYTTSKNVYYVSYSIHNDYIHQKPAIIIYSHGGLSFNLIKNDIDALDQLYNFFDDRNILVQKIKDYNADIQHGGHYDKIDRSYNNIDICSKINLINQYLRLRLTKTCMEMNNNSVPNNIPSQNVLFTLATSAPFVPAVFIEKYAKNQFQEYSTLSFIENSPVLPGIYNMRGYTFTSSKYTIVQAIGHFPKGYATGIDLYENGSDICYIVNLDVSNSFHGSPINNHSSFASMIFEHNKPIIYSTINMTVSKNDVIMLSNNDQLDVDMNNIGNKFYVQSNQVANIENPQMTIICNIKNKLFDYELLENIKKTMKNGKEMYYHGKSNNNHILTINGTGFNKSFFELTEQQFKKFFEISQSGGKYNNRTINKYNMYKKKYDDLENILR